MRLSRCLMQFATVRLSGFHGLDRGIDGDVFYLRRCVLSEGKQASYMYRGGTAHFCRPAVHCLSLSLAFRTRATRVDF